jgi:hypothetical protein
MLRINTTRAVALAALLAAIVVTSALAAGDGTITVGPSTVLVYPKGYRFTVNVTCPPSLDAKACDGLLDIKTVPIKPYRSIAKKKWVVGALPFSIPAGTTAPVRGRLLAGALVQAKHRGKVKVLVRIVREGVEAGSQALTLKLNGKR